MNWGYKIAIVIGMFLVGMLGMVYYASIQTNDMIDDNYYQKELEYQQVIDAQKNLAAITSDNIMSQSMFDVVITLPLGTFEQMTKGQVELLRNDSKDKDFLLEIKPDGFNRRTIPKSSLSKGMYRARIRWTNGDKEFYREENVFVE